MTMPKRYRLIPVSVEAIKIEPDSVQRAALWCGGFEVTEVDPDTKSLVFIALNIPTEQEIKRASLGDYVVKDPRGGIRVMSGKEFESQYELI
jgi:hypothetical protein